ncbi:unnamed protein product [Closterium sp. NIES-64]|nr:unnamed protein product [Closterium sp. NIES-64]
MQQMLNPKRFPIHFAYVAVAPFILIALLSSSSYMQSQDCFCRNLENPELTTAAAAATAAVVTASASYLSGDLANARRDLESRGPSPSAAAVPAAGDSQLLPAATTGSVSAFSRGGNDGAGAGANNDAASADDDDSNRPFIYVYDTQSEWTEGMKGRPKEWFSDQYEVESVLTELLMRSNAIRTTDPEKATLFYIPYYSSNHIAHVNKNEKNMMDKSAGEVSKAWHNILTMIRRDYPYFNRTNGRDHFGTSTFDHGRCLALPWVNPDLYGEMFFIVLNGDRLARTIHSSKKRNMQIIGYNYNMTLQPQYPDIPCYMPDRDIVVPAFVGGQLPMVSPFTGNRTMRAIFRFSTQPSHRAPLTHHGHSLRPELLKGAVGEEGGVGGSGMEWGRRGGTDDLPLLSPAGPQGASHAPRPVTYAPSCSVHVQEGEWGKGEGRMYGRQRIKGWSFAARGERQTNKEWQMAVFCICPPGHSQWTSRPFKWALPVGSPSGLSQWALPVGSPSGLSQWALPVGSPSGLSQWTSRPFKALISGCIPVTFFRDHDNPWDDELDYSSFSINIDPDDIASLRSRLETAPVEQLQRGVETVQSPPPSLTPLCRQRMFKWSGNHTQGAKYELMKRLRQRGKQLSSTSLFL